MRIIRSAHAHALCARAPDFGSRIALAESSTSTSTVLVGVYCTGVRVESSVHVHVATTSQVMGNKTSQEPETSIFGSDGKTPRLYEEASGGQEQEEEEGAGKWPLVYSEHYNIGFLGLEKVHPFDSGKWGKIFRFLKGRSACGTYLPVCFQLAHAQESK